MATDEVGAKPRPEPGTVAVEIHAPHVATIILRGECDISTAPRLSDAFERRNQSTHAIVDLSECEFIDSTIVGVLAAALQDAQAQGRQFSLVLPATASPVVQRIVDVMRLRDIMPVYESSEAARPAPPAV